MNVFELKKINRILSDFGFVDGSSTRQKVRWMDTSAPEMEYFIESGMETRHLTSLTVVQRKWARHLWSEVLGPGWVLAIWKPPLARADFEARFGKYAPYDAKGSYEPIENTKREPDRPPTIGATRAARDVLKCMFEAGASIDGKFDQALHQVCPRCSTQVKPLDTSCDYCGGAIEEARFAGNAFVDQANAQYDKEMGDARKKVQDDMDDTFPAFGKIPGIRGQHVSIGGTAFGAANKGKSSPEKKIIITGA